MRRIALAPQGSLIGSAPTLLSKEASCMISLTSSAVFAFCIGARPAFSAALASSMVRFTSIASVVATEPSPNRSIPETTRPPCLTTPKTLGLDFISPEYMTSLPMTVWRL